MVFFSEPLKNILQRMNRKKPLDENYLNTDLRRCLGVKDLTVLGMSGMLGAGLYVLTGTVAKNTAGPAVILSYMIASAAAFMSALCYAEFGSKIPSTGSSYVFTYITMGEFWGFLMGWNMVLEHGVGSASVAKAWSGYIDAVMGYPVKRFFIANLSLENHRPLGEYPDLVALAVVLILCCLVGLGAESSTKFNLLFMFINMVVVFFIIITGFCLADVSNWTKVGDGFWHFGFAGVLSGASRCFFAFAGFDVIASSCEEARNPRKDIPIALAISLITVTLSYIGVSAVLTLMIPWNKIVPESAFTDVYSHHEGWRWAQIVVTCGALCTMTTSMFAGLFVLPRILYAIAKDGLLCPLLAKVNYKTQVPLWSVSFTGILCGGMATLFDLETLVQFMSIGTLTSYSFVAACVILLRYGAVGDSSLVQLSNSPFPVELNSNEKFSNPTETDDDKNKTPAAAGSEKRMFGETSLLVNNLQIERPVQISAESLSKKRKVKLKDEYSEGRLENLLSKFNIDDIILVSLIISVGFATVGMLIIVYGLEFLKNGSWWAWITLIISISSATWFLFIICAHNQQKIDDNDQGVKTFNVPFVPILPYICIIVNIFLMIKLEPMTWIRLVIWIIVGITVYFFYGYHHSLLNPNHKEVTTCWDVIIKRTRTTTIINKIVRKPSIEQQLIASDED